MPKAVSHIIGGKRFSSMSHRLGDITNPATGKVVAQADLAGLDVVDQAVEVALHVFASWSTSSLATRKRILFNFRELS